KKNRLSYWKKEILDQLAILMGGRAAEELFLSDMSSGAQQDIAQATKLARAMICEWGMNDKLGTVSYDESNSSNQYFGVRGYSERSYSEETAKEIDSAVKELLDTAHKRAIQIISDNKEKVDLLAAMLIEFETLDKDDVKEIMEGTWDINKKKKRLKIADELQKKAPPPPPPVESKSSKLKNEGQTPQEA
ncbi:MAG: hypothetical protein ACD_20C00427G0001, partial [uncultured bacterium]